MLDENVSISVELRLEKAHQCLRDAELLLSTESYAACANRTYFCIFHTIRAALITIGFSARTHSGNIAEFRRSFIKTGIFPKNFSDIIGFAFDVRNDSDYNEFYIISKDDVISQMNNAAVFLDTVEAYIKAL